MSAEELLVVGLGNPGLEYTRTRHNLGYRVVEAVAADLGLSFRKERKLKGGVAQGEYEGRRLRLFKPTTYMNLSGQAVRACKEYYQIPLAQILVIVDDVYLKLGMMRLRPSGGTGGHKGLKSIEASLGSAEYPRLRMGVGSEELQEGELEDFVLGEFTAPERAELDLVVPRGVDVVRCWVAKGIEAATPLAAELSIHKDRAD